MWMCGWAMWVVGRAAKSVARRPKTTHDAPLEPGQVDGPGRGARRRRSCFPRTAAAPAVGMGAGRGEEVEVLNLWGGNKNKRSKTISNGSILASGIGSMGCLGPCGLTHPRLQPRHAVAHPSASAPRHRRCHRRRLGRKPVRTPRDRFDPTRSESSALINSSFACGNFNQGTHRSARRRRRSCSCSLSASATEREASISTN